MEKEFEVWEEGFRATGNSGSAICLGKFLGKDFAEAAERAINKRYDDPSLFNKEELTYWGSKLFDNEKDAREAFG